MENYTVGTKLIYQHSSYGKHEIIRGQVIENQGTISVHWETGQFAIYDENWLNNNTKIERQKC